MLKVHNNGLRVALGKKNDSVQESVALLPHYTSLLSHTSVSLNHTPSP